MPSMAATRSALSNSQLGFPFSNSRINRMPVPQAAPKPFSLLLLLFRLSPLILPHSLTWLALNWSRRYRGLHPKIQVEKIKALHELAFMVSFNAFACLEEKESNEMIWFFWRGYGFLVPLVGLLVGGGTVLILERLFP